MALPLLSATLANPLVVEAPSPAGGAGSKQAEVFTPADKVTLRSVHKVKQEARKQESDKGAERRKNAGRTADSIRFTYNFKGDLRIFFMDSANKLVYQTPPVQFLRMTDLMRYHGLSVNTEC